MRIFAILGLFGSVALLAGGALAENTTLFCRGGDECRIVRSDGEPSKGAFTKANAPTPAPRAASHQAERPRDDSNAYPNVGYRRYIASPPYPPYRGWYRGHGPYPGYSRFYDSGRHYGRSFGVRRHHVGRSHRHHHRRHHVGRSRGHRRHHGGRHSRRRHHSGRHSRY